MEPCQGTTTSSPPTPTLEEWWDRRRRPQRGTILRTKLGIVPTPPLTKTLNDLASRPVYPANGARARIPSTRRPPVAKGAHSESTDRTSESRDRLTIQPRGVSVHSADNWLDLRCSCTTGPGGSLSNALGQCYCTLESHCGCYSAARPSTPYRSGPYR